MPAPDRFAVGVDIGGTFTDAVIVSAGGEVTIGKVSTTPDDFSSGFFDAIAAATRQLGRDERELLSETSLLAHGTTVGINALVTGEVAKTALLTTKGHGDAIRAMTGGGRIRGASLEELLDYRLSERADPVVPREQVFEISERVDRSGEVVVELSDDELEYAIESFAARGIEAVAVAFLWSFLRPEHEQRTAARIRERWPGLFVSCSHEVAPRIGEYARTVSTVMNAQIGPLMLQYIERITRGAHERGFGGSVQFARSEGGLAPAAEAARHPLATLQSGPVAGVVGGASVAGAMGFANVIVTDMGGTTLDVASIEANRVHYLPESEVVRQQVYLRRVDVASIGAGGGSVAWIDEASGSLRVGPRSAGARPGPLCYGRGGREVTVTDADLVLGILDASRPLAGGLQLDADAARRGVAALGERVGLPLEACAAGIVEIVDSRMEDLIRRMTMQRGADPRAFVLWAYGGASGSHAGLYAPGVGVDRVVFPLANTASVWSAYGLTRLHQARTFEADAALHTPLDLRRLRELLSGLEASARDYARAHRLGAASLVRRAAMRYPLQVHEVEVDLPEGAVDSSWASRLVGAFRSAYEARFGEGTAYAQAGVVVTALRVTLQQAPMARPLPRVQPTGAHAKPARERPVFWRELAASVATPVYDGIEVPPGARVPGPAIIEYPQTTIAVRPGQRLDADAHGNLILKLRSGENADGL